ncbi:DUF4236 domain-containing protein [Desulfitobacterium sp. AusDCA]|uniref:DUF4236 domain-containing protein n=1 Tax=Desulfitobacterium sp. AusDCA TaxID=3240383 RepID=UPI003DA6EC29
MGFYFRKSISFGGVRFNFSKSGIGASVGVKGFRLGTGPRGNYIHIGQGGVYYRAALGRKKDAVNRVLLDRPENPPSDLVQSEHLLFQEIESGDISLIVDSSSQDIVNEINAKRKKFPLWPLALLCVLIPTVGMPLALLGGILIYAIVDKKRKMTILFYDIEDQSEQEIQQFYNSFEELMNCNMAWHISAQAHVQDRKYHAGANQVVKKTRIKIGYKTPPYIKTNVMVPTIPVGKQTLYLFPDRVLIYEGKTVGGLVYDSLSVTQREQRFIEDGMVPRDGTVVDHTWRFVNKSGGPDRRFSNNRQLPILMYSEVQFCSDTGLNELIQLSKQNAGAMLAEKLDHYKNSTIWKNSADAIPQAAASPLPEPLTVAQGATTPTFQVLDKEEKQVIKITTEIVTSASDDIIPIESRIKDAIQSSHGLYPHEILVLDYAHTYYTSGNEFQSFWWYRYGVRNVQAVLNSLVDRGFLQTGDLRTALDKETVKAIKEVLKSYNCKVTGKKAELVQRALDEISSDELNILFPKRTYVLTEIGQAALNEEAYVPYIHRHGIEDLDIWSLNKLVHTQPYMPYRDKLWGYLNQRSMKHFSESNFGLYRNCRFNMAQFLIEENKYEDALGMLAEVIFQDLSGANNNYDPQFLEIYAERFFPYESSLATTAPGIISVIVKCQEELGYTDDELKTALIDRMSKLNVPLQLFTVDECAQIVLLEKAQNVEELKELYKKAKIKFKQKYPIIKI